MIKSYQNEDNLILREDYDMWTTSGGSFYPQVIINNMTYRGDLKPDSIFKAICAGFN